MNSAEHNQIVKEEWIEKYLLHQLSKDEETLLEEHLLYCEECRKELQRFEAIIEGVENIMFSDHFNNQELGNKKITRSKNAKSIFLSKQFIRIAASIIFLLGATTVLFVLYLHHPKQNILTETNDSILQKIMVEPTDSLKKQNIPDDKIKPEIKNNAKNKLLASNYKPDPFYESMVNNIVRSSDFKMLEPSDSISIDPGQNISFRWQMNTYEELELTIFTNKGKAVKNLVSKSPAGVNDLKQEGLYYWKLDTHDETVAAGKIYVID